MRHHEAVAVLAPDDVIEVAHVLLRQPYQQLLPVPRALNVRLCPQRLELAADL